jgi:hypothetical protein
MAIKSAFAGQSDEQPNGFTKAYKTSAGETETKKALQEECFSPNQQHRPTMRPKRELP